MKRKSATSGNVTNRKVILSIGLIPIFACVAFFALLLSGYIRPSNEKMENFFDAPFPDEATNIKATFHLWPSTDVWHKIRFELPPENLSQFLDEICLEEQELSSDYPARGATFVPWWRPQRADIYEGGRCIDKSNGKGYTVIIDKTNPDLYVIYLSATTF